jgi:hypothetical protein
MGIHLEKLWKPLVESLRPKKLWKCLKTTFEKLSTERCNNQVKANLKRSKEISKFELGWESTKESKQGKQKIERWNVYNLRRLGLGQDMQRL